jgi:hypothetical protein
MLYVGHYGRFPFIFDGKSFSTEHAQVIFILNKVTITFPILVFLDSNPHQWKVRFRAVHLQTHTHTGTPVLWRKSATCQQVTCTGHVSLPRVSK